MLFETMLPGSMIRAFRHIPDLQVRYLPYGEQAEHREAMARFGHGLKAIDAIARRFD